MRAGTAPSAARAAPRLAVLSHWACTLLRPLRRRMIRARIAWERDQIFVIDHHAEIDPIRRRFISRQIEALEVQLIQLGGTPGDNPR